jgi:cytoskeleton protein RodZ
MAAAGPGAVVFRASAQSWIEVRDAKGAVPIRKVLAAGESANVSGAMPLQVTVGNVEATELDVRGQRFDLKAIARDNVARFQIK